MSLILENKKIVLICINYHTPPKTHYYDQEKIYTLHDRIGNRIMRKGKLLHVL